VDFPPDREQGTKRVGFRCHGLRPLERPEFGCPKGTPLFFKEFWSFFGNSSGRGSVRAQRVGIESGRIIIRSSVKRLWVKIYIHIRG
jgi:hypothetical protein